MKPFFKPWLTGLLTLAQYCALNAAFAAQGPAPSPMRVYSIEAQLAQSLRELIMEALQREAALAPRSAPEFQILQQWTQNGNPLILDADKITGVPVLLFFPGDDTSLERDPLSDRLSLIGDSLRAGEVRIFRASLDIAFDRAMEKILKDTTLPQDPLSRSRLAITERLMADLNAHIADAVRSAATSHPLSLAPFHVRDTLDARPEAPETKAQPASHGDFTSSDSASGALIPLDYVADAFLDINRRWSAGLFFDLAECQNSACTEENTIVGVGGSFRF